MSACLSPSALARIARGVTLVPAADAQHAEECAFCTRRVAFLRRAIAAGAGEIGAEAKVVDGLLWELSQARRSTWWRVVQDPRFQRPSLVRRLLALALDARDCDALLAADYSKAATTIIEVIAARELETADLRFDAWRHHAMLLREIAQYEKCSEAFVRAEKAAASAADPELSHAIIVLSRALLNIEPDVWRPDEARALLERAERVFTRRDPERLTRTKTVRGMLSLRAGDIDGAASIFAEVLAATSRDDERGYSDALRNALGAAVLSGRIPDDVGAQIDALEAIDERLGAWLHVLRDRWMRGLVCLANGLDEEAVALLRDSMRGFEAKGDPDIAIRVGIDAVRALLTSERYKECVELCRDLVSRSVGHGSGKVAWSSRPGSR